MNHSTTGRTCAAMVLIVALAACSRGDAPGGTSQPGAESSFVSKGTGSAQLSYQANARVFERADALRLLAGVSTDGSTLLFHATPMTIALKADDVLVLKGLLARKVLATEVDGELVAVLTGPVSIAEVLNNGKLHFEAPLRFSPRVAANTSGASGATLERVLNNLVPAARADAIEKAGDVVAKANEVGGKVVSVVKQGWKTDFSATPGKGRVDLNITATRDIAGFKAMIQGQGYLADFELVSDIEVADGTMKQLSAAFKSVNGLMDVTWDMGKETPGRFEEEAQIKLPAGITVPLYELLDGFPLYLEVSSALIIHPFITGGMEIMHGKFRLTYDGTQHFRASGPGKDLDDKMGGDIRFVEGAHLSPLAPVGMAINLAAPRIELTLDPLKVLSDLQGSGSVQKLIEDAAKKADDYAQKLKDRLAGTQIGTAIQKASDALGNPTAAKMADSMKSNAMVYIQLVTTSTTTNSGASVITPCTHTELGMMISVGAAAQAMGQNTPRVSRTVFEKKIVRIDPPGTKLCDY